MVQPKVLAKGRYYPKDISISYKKESNRKIDKSLELKVSQKWEEMLKEAKSKGKLIYNGESYRLNNLTETNCKLHFEVSKFRYSTRRPIREFPEELEKLGEDYYSRGLAIGGFIKTTDDLYIFGKRSGKTMETNSEDFIGGIVDEVDLKTGEDIFKLNKREIFEELNITSAEIADIYLVGVVSTGVANVVIISQTFLNVDSEHVNQLFDKRKDSEMKSLRFVKEKDLKTYLKGLGGHKNAVVELIDL